MEPLQPTATAFRHGLALELALQHLALSTDPRILCTAAQACKAWQQAVQQCSACNTVVVLGPTVSLQQACSFKRWLCKHSGLVKSFSASLQAGSGQDACHIEAVQALLQQVLEEAACMPAAATAAAAAAPWHGLHSLEMS
uniref:Uncharacterized protein n=1 Tax=Tetradesmus obliquus TaxID=3088 RepID=A0A383VVN3_TETOB|eukprot:jgi/Sobl393_1/16828/SZX68909.1